MYAFIVSLNISNVWSESEAENDECEKVDAFHPRLKSWDIMGENLLVDKEFNRIGNYDIYITLSKYFCSVWKWWSRLSFETQLKIEFCYRFPIAKKSGK